MSFIKNFILILISISTTVTGQKYDHVWLFGYNGDSSSTKAGGCNLIFNQNSVDTARVKRKANLCRSNLSICDEITGDLLFYSNGCHVYNKNHEIMENGENINAGTIRNDWCDFPGFLLEKLGCILPDPKNNSKYYIVYRNYDLTDSGEQVFLLKYATIEFNQMHNLGVLVEKEIILLNQFLHIGHFDVVKHSNGRDFWILTYNYISDSAITFLFKEGQFIGPHYQFFPIPIGKDNWSASSCMSPDGTTNVRFDSRAGLSVMRFDRNSGMLNNLKYYPFWTQFSNTYSVTACQISPNSRFLYVTTQIYLFQFDLQASDIMASRILVDSFDGYKSPFGSTFYLMQLGPDGKIYMNCTNGENVLHVINQTDQPGKLCDFKKHSLRLPTYNAFSMPYFPNYRLGPLSDTNNPKDNEIYLYPNPANDKISVSSIIKGLNIIYDVTGRKILETYHDNIEISHLPSGMYYFCIQNNDHLIWTSKFIKL